MKRFPLILSSDERKAAMAPTSVPWSLLAPHEAQAMTNHSQTLERLAERGGLAPNEMAAVLSDEHWRHWLKRDPAEVLDVIREALDEHLRNADKAGGV